MFNHEFIYETQLYLILKVQALIYFAKGENVS